MRAWRPQPSVGFGRRVGRFVVTLAWAHGLATAPAQPVPPPASPAPMAVPFGAAPLMTPRQSLLELEQQPQRRTAIREEVLNVLGRSPTAVFEVSQANRWLAPVLEAMANQGPPDQAIRTDLADLARRVREDATGPGVVAFDNRMANWSVALSLPRPHTTALEIAATFGLIPVIDRSNMYDAGDVALLAMYRDTGPSFGQPSPMDAAMTMVSDSRLGLLVAMSSPGEANRANTYLAGSRVASFEPMRLNERLRSALASPPDDASTVRGALDLSRALRPLDPQTASWVQRTLGLPAREGTLLFDAREHAHGLAWRLGPAAPTPTESGQGQQPDTAGPTPALWPFFAELPRQGASLAVALERTEAVRILAAYEELVPAAGTRADQPASEQLEADLTRTAGVSLRSTVEPLLGDGLGLVVYPPPPGGSPEATGTIVVVVQTHDELTLARLAATVLGGQGVGPPALGQALGLGPESTIEMATARERLALAVGPEARARLDQWQSAANQRQPSDAIVDHLDAGSAQLVGWLDLAQWADLPPGSAPLPLWWSTRNRAGGELDVRGLLEADVPQLAEAVVAGMGLMRATDPALEQRLALAHARLGAVDAAMGRYWQLHKETCSGIEQLVAAQVGLEPADILDPFSDPPQPLGIRLVGSSRWMITSVGPDAVADPQDLRYNPRHGALSRGDLQLLGGQSPAGESIISDLPATP